MLIARHEISGRRIFDLAHELFHILTWEAMPPKQFEEAVETASSNWRTTSLRQCWHASVHGRTWAQMT